MTKANLPSSSFDLRMRSVVNKEPTIAFGKAVPILGASKAEVQIGLGKATSSYGAGKIVLDPESFASNDFETTDALFSIFDSGRDYENWAT